MTIIPKASSRYLVISGEDDNTIPYVENHLDRPFLFISTRDILKGDALSYHIKSGKTFVSRGGQAISGVKSVWFRRLMLVQEFELPVPETKVKYAKDAIRYFNDLLFSQFPDSLWVSDFYAIERANDKLLQLRVAAELGFNVPDTLVTASESEAVKFISSYKTVIAKPNYSAVFYMDGKNHVFYTSVVDASTDFSGLCVAPAILQKAVDVKTELRVTVVGKLVFAAAVVNHTEEGVSDHVRDWRVHNLIGNTGFKAFELPDGIKQKCINLIKSFGLKFGAIDIIIDKRGKYWFLENNPCGQWAFIEDATGQPIGKAIAQLLMRGK